MNVKRFWLLLVLLLLLVPVVSVSPTLIRWLQLIGSDQEPIRPTGGPMGEPRNGIGHVVMDLPLQILFALFSADWMLLGSTRRLSASEYSIRNSFHSTQQLKIPVRQSPSWRKPSWITRPICFFFTSFRGSLFFCVCSSRSYRFSHIRNAIRGDLHVVESNFPTLLSFHFSLLLFCLFACFFFFVFVFFSFMNIASVMERLPTNRIACDECGVYRKRTAVTVESTLQTGT